MLPESSDDEHHNDHKINYAETRETERERIHEILDTLPLLSKRAFLLHRRNALEFSEIAQQLNISQKDVGKHIANAIKALRLKLI